MKINTIVDIELNDNPLEWQIQDLERRILENSREAARQTFLEALVVYEKKLLKWNAFQWQPKDRCPKEISTIFGKMKIERYRVWDLNEKKSRYPLDEALGIGKWQRETKDFKQVVINQAVVRSYRQSTKEVFNQTGVKQNKMSTWYLVQQESRNQQSQKPLPMKWKTLAMPRAPEAGKPDPCPALGIDLDGTYCRSWKKKRRLKDHEVKVAVLYRHKVRVGKKRWRLKDKTVIMSGPGERLEAFLNRVTHHAITHYGLHEKTCVVVHGDGDAWIRNYAKHYFVDALYRLDPWHVFKKMRETTGLKELPKSWVESVYGHPDQLIGELKTFQMQFEKKSEDHNQIEDLIKYLTNNREGLLPSNVSLETKIKHPRLFKRGSGTIERNIDWTVCQRFKQSRMSWSKKGLENLLFLREDYLNDYRRPKYQPIPARIRSWKSFL